MDVLINNAGVTRDMTFKKMDKINWDAVMHANLDSCFNMTKQVCDSMMDRGWAESSIISSVNGQKARSARPIIPLQRLACTGSPSAGARSGAQGRHRQHHLARLYRTKMVMAIPKEVLDSKIIPQIPMDGSASPKKWPVLFAYLASEEAAFVTGANIAINGGQHMQ